MDWLLRLVAFLLMKTVFLVKPIHWLLRKKRLAVPPVKDPIINLSATTLARKIREREISSEHVVEAYIKRIKEVNPILNAVVEDRYEDALREARNCDKRIETGEVNAIRLEIEQPLYGVPLTVKESCSVKGLNYTGGCLLRKGVKADSDGLAVEALRNAGAIPLCVTNTPELCLGFEANNYLYGKTNNPYDTRRTSGGSSGGEGALLGAGASVIGVGSDIAGSIRIPALFNGIFGHKPTPGIIPIRGHFPFSEGKLFQQYLVIGPMARYCEDLYLAMKVMSANCGTNLQLDEPVALNKLNVFYMEDAGQTVGVPKVDEDIKRAVTNASSYFKGYGCNVKRFNVDMRDALEYALSTFFTMDEMPQLLLNPDDPKKEKNLSWAVVKSLFGLSPYTRTALYLRFLKDVKVFMNDKKISHYKEQGKVLRENFMKILGEDNVLVCPSYTSAALMHNETIFNMSSVLYCVLFNLWGFPSTQVPMGLNKDGLPVGVQVVAMPNQDRLCLAVAKELEKGFGGWIPFAA
ncbi:fatty-acid amide hydrolase 2 [Cephus cinctus]|uniref:Fatty-acid amide hydrolase 2 n=1 Tax=Cephus cinctus TaxID=211228 RepID=A0AAJ7FFW2_CEPCN|nr:fatty-acid amide hydrolase 2 [Cephus cinctus]